MTPALSSPRRAAAYALSLVVLVSMPALVGRTGCLDPRDVYPAIPYKYGPFPWIQQQTYTETRDVDVAILGSSQIWCAINTPFVQKKFSEALGREAEVITLGWPWAGFDALYVMAQNLLEHRRVHTLVVYDESRGAVPHLHSSRWFRLGENFDSLAGLPWDAQAGLYGGAVLGTPRHLLSLVRPNLLEDPAHCRSNFWDSYYHAPNIAEQRGALRARLGYGVSPRFVPLTPHGAATPADVVVYSAGTRGSFRFTGPPMHPYHAHFARKLAELCRARGAHIVFLHTPVLHEREEPLIVEREIWPEALSAPVDVIGIPPAKLFAGIAAEDVPELFFEDGHLNQNGQEMFTPLVTPALLELYEKSIHHP